VPPDPYVSSDLMKVTIRSLRFFGDFDMQYLARIRFARREKS